MDDQNKENLPDQAIVLPPEPSAQPPSSNPSLPNMVPPKPAGAGRGALKKPILILVSVIIIIIAIAAGYFWGKGSHAQAADKNPTVVVSPAALKIPGGATEVTTCAKGLGAQYVLPKDIPEGPVYNVYNGKVIGLEYMTPLNSTGTNSQSGSMGTGSSTSMDMGSAGTTTLALFGQKYDHINVTLMPEGHAGFAVPHYMADVMMVPKSTTDKITCGSSGSAANSSTGQMPSGSAGSSSSSSSSGSKMSM